MQGTKVWSLVRELILYMLHSAVRKKKKKGTRGEGRIEARGEEKGALSSSEDTKIP